MNKKKKHKAKHLTRNIEPGKVVLDLCLYINFLGRMFTVYVLIQQSYSHPIIGPLTLSSLPISRAKGCQYWLDGQVATLTWTAIVKPRQIVIMFFI